MISTIEKYVPASAPVAGVLLCSGVAGIAAGLLFSIVAEKPFRRGAIRDAMLARLDTALAALLRMLGIEPFITLTVRARIPAPPIATPPVGEIVTA
jgi:hypothetical protein